MGLEQAISNIKCNWLMSKYISKEYIELNLRVRIYELKYVLKTTEIILAKLRQNFRAKYAEIMTKSK